MKKYLTIILILFLIFITIFSTYSKTKNKNNKSNFLRKLYDIPTKFQSLKDEMKSQKKIISSGIILYFSKMNWTNNTGMWWIIRDIKEKKNAVLIINASMTNWSFFNEVYIKIDDEIIHFSESKKNLSNATNTITDGVNEFVACYMDIQMMKKIIAANLFNISIRGKKGKLDYIVYKESDWFDLLNK